MKVKEELKIFLKKQKIEHNCLETTVTHDEFVAIAGEEITEKLKELKYLSVKDPRRAAIDKKIENCEAILNADELFCEGAIGYTKGQNKIIKEVILEFFDKKTKNSEAFSFVLAERKPLPIEKLEFTEIQKAVLNYFECSSLDEAESEMNKRLQCTYGMIFVGEEQKLIEFFEKNYKNNIKQLRFEAQKEGFKHVTDYVLNFNGFKIKPVKTKNIVSVLNGNFFAKTKEDDDEQKRIKEMLSRDIIESVSKELLKIKEQGFFYI